MTEYYETTPNVTEQSKENKIVNKALTPLQTPHLTGLKLKADISINGLVLNTIDENNVVWVVTEIEGWWELPETELPDLPRGYADGSYDAVGRFSNRIMSLNGSFLPQDPADAPAARDALIRAINLIKTGGWLKVYEGGVDANPRGSYVRLSGTPLITSVNARGRHDFSIGLKAVDPIKYEFVDSNGDGYSASVITASGSGTGSVTINNAGNIEVPIIIELSAGLVIPGGSPTSITNTESDQEMVILSGTSAGNRLEIDTYNREILEVQYAGSAVVNVTNARSKASVLVDWIYLQPGDNVLTIAGFTAGATCTIYHRSGWIG
jgi:hypothetical protein